MTVLIAGGGIAGLSLALTCHQIGVPFRVFEAVGQIKPLGVGINIQPNAVRELFDLGLEKHLEAIGVQTREYGMFTKHGLEIWTEPRGRLAGYHWPQYSVHRGKLQMLLYETLLERAGPGCVATNWRSVGFVQENDGASLELVHAETGETRRETGHVLIGADGIHSSIRAQMNPTEGPPIWGGAVLWRGMAKGKPFRSEASMALIGHASQRIVSYPISAPDPETGLADMNWIAELTYDPDEGWNKEDWNRQADVNDFLPQFSDWHYDWFDFPALVRNSSSVYEYPMVDRDPLDQWAHGCVSLMGDAAHATYPVGSNGASQAIVDARQMGRAFLDHGVNRVALLAYEEKMRPATTRVTLANRGNGPDAVLQMIEDRCGGLFDDLEDVASHQELADHAERYKAIAGTAIETLNKAAPTIAAGEVVTS